LIQQIPTPKKRGNVSFKTKKKEKKLCLTGEKKRKKSIKKKRGPETSRKATKLYPKKK